MPYFTFIFCLYVSLVSITNSAVAENETDHLSLNQVFDQIYLNNPTLQAAEAELEGTKELSPQARAGWLPTLDAEASLYATDVESSNFGAGDGATTKDMSINLQQPLFRGGRTFAEVARAKDLIRAGESVLNRTKQNLLLDAAEAFFDLLRDLELHNLRLKNQNNLGQEAQATQERWELGDITKTDVQQAKARLARAKSSLIQAEGNLEISKARLEKITGFSPPDKLLVPDVLFHFPETLEEMVTLAQDQNPQIHIARYEQSAAEHNVDATFRELLPHIFAFASYNKQYDPQPGITDETEVQTIGVRATIALYEGGATRSRIKEAKIAAKRRGYQIDETRRSIRQEVTSNWRSYKSAKSQIKARQSEINAAESAMEGVKEEARIGQRSVLDILDADEDVIDAKAALARAKRNALLAEFALAKSIGLLTPEILSFESAENIH